LSRSSRLSRLYTSSSLNRRTAISENVFNGLSEDTCYISIKW
jgi:hypothetical protein